MVLLLEYNIFVLFPPLAPSIDFRDFSAYSDITNNRWMIRNQNRQNINSNDVLDQERINQNIINPRKRFVTSRIKCVGFSITVFNTP